MRGAAAALFGAAPVLAMVLTLALGACTALPPAEGSASVAQSGAEDGASYPAPFRQVPVVAVPAPPASPPREVLAEERDPLFAKCSACHSLRPGIKGIGPSLAGVFGRDIAALPTFRYSDQLAAREGVWDPATLDRWLANPRGMVPGTRMLFAGLSNPLERAQVIAFLQRQPASR